MKRYVKEFANDYVNGYPVDQRKEVKQRTDKIVNACRRGLITDFEAIRAITDLYYNVED